MEKGMLIAFEGMDSSGKATQAKIICEFLKSKGREAIVTGEPVYETATGKLIYDMLHSSDKDDPFSMQLAYSLDRSFHVVKLINPALQKGKDVIADRYMFSTIAYAMALGVKGEQLDALKKVNGTFPYPDITFIMDIDPDESARRMMFKRSVEQQDRAVDKFEKKTDFMKKVRAAYQKLPTEYQNLWVIDANGSVDEVSKSIIKILEDRLSK
jgi:dTMP kinase